MTSSSSSSTFKPKLNDQEYLELVFENGQIQAKSSRSKLFSLQNQRTKSIMELYELEYNEDFKKSIKNHTYHHQVVPDHYHDVSAESTNNRHVKKAKNTIEFLPSDERSVVAERSIGLGFDSFCSSTGHTEEDCEGSSTYLSSSLDDDESEDNARPRLVPARTRKRRSNEVSNSSPESKQRNDIDKRMRTLQNLLPNSHKDDNVSLLDETINYMTTLQHQVQMMTMNNNRFVTTPSMMIPPLVVPHYSQMGMQMCVPQFLSHPGLVPMQDSMLFASVENYYSPQYVPPSYDIATYPNQVPNSTC